MKSRDINSLEYGPLEENLYHISGKLMFNGGHYFNKTDLKNLKEANISRLLELSRGESEEELVFSCKFRRTPLAELDNGKVMSNAVFGQDGRMLLNAGAVISDVIIAKLVERGVENIFVKRTQNELGANNYRKYKRIVQDQEKRNKIITIDITIPDERMIDSSRLNKNTIDLSLTSQNMSIDPGEDALFRGINFPNQLMPRPEELISNFYTLHKNAISDTKDIFNTVKQNKTVSPKSFREVIGNIVGAVIKDRELLVNLTNIYQGGDDYFFHHAFNVTSLSVNIGCYLGYDKEQIFELGYGAFLYDIGMLKIPRDITHKDGKLTASERIIVQRHPIFALDFLQKIPRLPLTTPFVAYQAHERIDGKGYPNHRHSRHIHDFSKIVAIADIYDALTRDRPYRKHLTPYRAMEGVLKMASRKMIDSDMLRAFLNAISVFPVGSFVVLDNDAIAKVVGTTDQITKPIVSIIYNEGKTVKPPVHLDLRIDGTPKIVRSIDGSKASYNVDPMYGF